MKLFLTKFMKSTKIVKKLFLGFTIFFTTHNIQSIACEYIGSSNQWRASPGGFWFKVVPSYKDSSSILFNKCTLTSSKEKYDPGGFNYLTNWVIQPHTDRWKYYECGKHKIVFIVNYVYDGWSIADTTGAYHQIRNFSKKEEKFHCSYEKYKDSYRTTNFRGSKLILVERTNYSPIKFDF